MSSEEMRQPVNILAVDDHPENLLAIDGILSRPEYRVIVARSGGEALKKILKHDFAVVLLDVMMPGMDGFETARLIRQREATKALPIIFLTAEARDVELLYRGYEAGGVDYLIKPIEPEILRAKVAVFVDLYRMADKIRRQEELLREAERKRSEEVRREGEAEYEATFEEAPAGIAHASADGRWLRVNQRFCDITGYSKEEALAMRFQDMTHPDDVAHDVSSMHKLLTGELTAYRREKRYIRKDGSPIWINLTVSLLRDPSGAPRKFIKVFEDITDRKHSEQCQRFLAQASERLLSSLDYRSTLAEVVRLAVASKMGEWCAVWLTDEEGSLECLEAAHALPHGAAWIREMSTRHLDAPDNDGLLVDALRRGEPRLVIKIPPEFLFASAADPALFAFQREIDLKSVIIAPVVVRGQVLALLALVSAKAARTYDRVDLRMAEELAHRAAFAIDNARLYREAQEAVRAREEFLSIASHELRTPITPLQLQLERLIGTRRRDNAPANKEVLPPRARDQLVRCERQVRRLAALIDNLLDVSRITAGRLELHHEEFDFAATVREVTARMTDGERGGDQVEVVTESAARGRWDRMRIEQVVTNLLSNAFKYGRERPISIRVSTTLHQVILEVRDQGIGIEPDQLPKIFERFERAVSNQAFGGLGLGLYITKQIIEAHGGTIEATSKPGEGSTFRVCLPLRSAESADVKANPQSQQEERSQEPRKESVARP